MQLVALHFCLFVYRVNNAEVVLGAHNIRNDEATQQTIPSNEFIIHSGWNPSTLVNDIALIKLSVPAQLNRKYMYRVNYKIQQKRKKIHWKITTNSTVHRK